MYIHKVGLMLFTEMYLCTQLWDQTQNFMHARHSLYQLSSALPIPFQKSANNPRR